MNYFDDPGSKLYSFESFAAGLAEDSFAVINFKGFEAISHSYDFEIMLVSSEKEVDLEELLQAQALFTIHRASGDDVLYNGILAEFDQLHEVNDLVFYRARLVPRLWWLNLTHHNQVFLNQSVIEFVEGALTDGGLETADFDLSTLSGYEPIEYTCQYDETHFNFVSRWLERNGIYYYFDQQADGEILTLTDTRFSHDALKQGADLFYNPASGLETAHLGEAIGSFTCRQKQLPKEIILKDYNYQKPSLDITSRMEVDPAGRGLSYLYGEFFATPEEGERFASIRAEELLCQKREFFGESTVPYIMPGFTFNLHNHYREEFNSEYLITEVTHEGNQTHLMSGGIASHVDSGQNLAIYHNSFKAIPGEVQFRPNRITQKPKISGTIHAKIDSEVDSEYAQIDEQGRYRVKLPFDINDDNIAGKGSAPIRMMQSYAGKKRGMQFPLVKGTEVLLTFIEGNPDRPVIAGAVSNPETQGPVNHENQTESVIQSGGANKIRMEDKVGSGRVVVHSAATNSWIRLGKHNDPIQLNGSDPVYHENGKDFTDPGAKVSLTADPTAVPIDVAASEVSFEGGTYGPISDFDPSQNGTWTFKYSHSATSSDEETRDVIVYEDDDELVDLTPDAASGIRIRTTGSLWEEGLNRHGDFIGGGVPAKDNVSRKSNASANANDPNEIGDLLDNFGDSYNPTGMLNYKTGNAQTDFATNVMGAANSARIQVSSMDTVTTQEGNIYDFGGYWNYNLGNSYAENHINQSAQLNQQHSVQTDDDWAGFALHTSLSYIWTVFNGVVGVIGASTIGASASKGAAVAAGVYTGAITTVSLVTSTVSTVMDAVNLSGDADNIGDVVGDGGPHASSKEIKTWAKKVGSSFADDGSQDMSQKYDKHLGTKGRPFVKPKNYVDKPMNLDTTWVEKNFGDSYSYSKGNAIEISHGNKEEHVKGDVYEFKYGGAREATNFSGKGFKTHWERSANGHKHEANWDTVTGQCVEFSYSKAGHFSFSLAMPTIPKLAIDISMASLDAKLALSAGTSINVEASASLALNVSLSAGFSIDFERSVGGKLLNDETTDSFEFKAVGMKAVKKAALEAEKKNTNMINAMMYISKNDVVVSKSGVRTESGELHADQSMFKFF